VLVLNKFLLGIFKNHDSKNKRFFKLHFFIHTVIQAVRESQNSNSETQCFHHDEKQENISYKNGVQGKSINWVKISDGENNIQIHHVQIPVM